MKCLLICLLTIGCTANLAGQWDDEKDHIEVSNQYRIVHLAGSDVIDANCPGWNYDSQLGCRKQLPDGRAEIWSLAAWMPTEHGAKWRPYALPRHMDLLTERDGGPYLQTEYVRRSEPIGHRWPKF